MSSSKTNLTHSIKFKLGVSVAIIMSIVVVSLGVIQYISAEKIVKQSATVKAKSDLMTGLALIDEWYPGPWEVKGDKLYKGDALMNDNFDVVDKIGELTGDTVTIFLKDTRIATNVKKSDGNRAVGTTVSEEVATTVLKNGKHFYGEANVVGKMYETAYMPIKDTTGEIIGIWYVGASKDVENELISNAMTITAISGILFLLGGAALLLYILNRMVVSPLNKLGDGVNKFAEGDFREEIRIQSNSEIGELSNKLNNMSKQLSSLMHDIMTNAESLSSNSQELAASNEEVGATMEEISSTSSEVASTAEQSYEAATKAVEETRKMEEVANEGNNTVKQTVNKIDSVADSSQQVGNAIKNLNQLSNQIGDITKVIANIADQTNMLALNAAIEAARAGDAGKGFAVVADEVRKLAEQSTDATEEINELISKIQTGVEDANNAMEHGAKEVGEGVELASKAGKALDDILNSVKGSIKVIEQIQQASKQSSEGMEQVASSNEQIASTIQEMSSATQDLAEIANTLQVSVDKFKISN
ncbi:MAG: methyl-accepting chemotaxis protein [Firmicutes bacterium]|nr:methyl-accepting chemotaxis protein [Bacillota bacterium]